MEGAALLERLKWHVALVEGLEDETPRVRSLRLTVPGWPGHMAGQHVNVRLTAEDGYQAQRSYSIASAPGSTWVELTVERLENGEVSPYLTSEVQVGDRLELRGPIGGWFVWDPVAGGPLLLVAGGSGIVPLMAMLRHRAATGARGAVRARLLYSCRTAEDIIYRQELDRMATADPDLLVRYTLTRGQPAGWAGGTGRIDGDMLAGMAWTPKEAPRIYICGPNGFVEAAASGLVRLGHAATCIRTERFGPSGGDA